jgi:hypothetical protein
MNRVARALACAIMAIVTLNACAKRLQAPAPAVIPPVVEPQIETPAEPAAKPIVRVKPKPVAPRPTLAPGLPALPETFSGLSKSEVAAILGADYEESERQPGEVWTYRANTCAVEFLFLLDVTRNDRYVADWVVTGPPTPPSGPPSSASQAQQRCLQKIQAAHGK